MAGKIPKSFIDELISCTDLVDLIDARVPLKRIGSNFTARCPFHDEKTPSFSVNREKQFYHCFGCGANGNAISFLMDYERQGFVEAVETLADMAGLTVPSEAVNQHTPVDNNQNVYALQQQAADYYTQQLKEHPESKRAVDYLKQRGVSGEIAARYHLGYASSGWQNLPKSFSPELLRAAGLSVTNEQGHSYDRFRNRIMFPIRDRRGRVIGFGGRVINTEDTPKYLNSPETVVFKKGREVYGLHELLAAVRKPERILIVEGYMDVIALAQMGFPCAVATLGTATSGEHVQLLFRYAHELVFCFDGDVAGQNAAWKAAETSLPYLRDDKHIRFLSLPAQHDPDTLIREEGLERFELRVKSALPFSEYFFQQLGQKIDAGSIEGQASLAQMARPLLEKIPAGAFKDGMLARLADKTGQERKQTLLRPRRTGNVRPALARTVPSTLRAIVVMLLQNPSFFALMDAETRVLLETHEKAGLLIRKLAHVWEGNPSIQLGGILESFRGEPEETQVRQLSVWDDPLLAKKTEVDFLDAIRAFVRNLKEERLSTLIRKAKVIDLSDVERNEMRKLLSQK
ncbi:DNA primase [Candidatus Methylospira mobilis]|uniref:DNA primase n=1 Tax=Candidatus Methylospira mobilis TaxID=1808979 RepID=A0A5Q0BRI1_9GAMM|nr:DNA primase [Candidatus Methylospira mobilis]QFY44804.1 DNA primase [Candidatus Methylospira mobilis]WNV05654.1 DNA primase [Candidatus Methylospira mobilis]